MKQMPNMTICDAIMYHITQITGESKNPAGKKFGRKMLRDTLAMQHDITHLEFNVATQWLIDNNYLKPLGQYTVGIGTGKDLKAYPLNGYAPYKKISPEQLDAEQSTSKTALEIEVADGEDNTPIPKSEHSTVLTNAERKEITRVIQRDVPAFVTKEASELEKIEQSLNALKSRLNGKTIDNLTIKLRTLDELARLLDPEISNVLNQIQNDLKEIAQ
jgi:hypothetical protein